MRDIYEVISIDGSEGGYREGYRVGCQFMVGADGLITIGFADQDIRVNPDWIKWLKKVEPQVERTVPAVEREALTLRDKFAMAALPIVKGQHGYTSELLARLAYHLADAMLAAREGK